MHKQTNGTQAIMGMNNLFCGISMFYFFQQCWNYIILNINYDTSVPPANLSASNIPAIGTKTLMVTSFQLGGVSCQSIIGHRLRGDHSTIVHTGHLKVSESNKIFYKHMWLELGFARLDRYQQ